MLVWTSWTCSTHALAAAQDCWRQSVQGRYRKIRISIYRPKSAIGHIASEELPTKPARLLPTAPINRMWTGNQSGIVIRLYQDLRIAAISQLKHGREWIPFADATEHQTALFAMPSPASTGSRFRGPPGGCVA